MTLVINLPRCFFRENSSGEVLSRSCRKTRQELYRHGEKRENVIAKGFIFMTISFKCGVFGIGL